MDFTLPPEVEEARSKAREFALRTFTDEKARYYDEMELFPHEIRNQALREGLIDYSAPWNILVTVEEFCKVDPGLALAALTPAFGSEIIMLFGTDEQKDNYLKKVHSGELTMGLAVTEAVAGSDVAGIATRIERQSDGSWIMNGSKMFITNGSLADFLLILGRSSPVTSPQERHRGLTLAIVESKWPGFSATKLTGKLGVRATDTAEIVLSDVRIPSGNIVGEPGRGFSLIMTFFNISRIYVAAMSVGIAQGALDQIIKKAQADPAFGNLESTQFAIAEIATRIEASKLLTYKAASYLFRFTPDPVLTSMAKWYASETATYAAERSLEVTGMDGAVCGLERLFRDAKIMEIWEGSNEIEKLVVHRMLMKRIGGI